jgi:hypothetical protein
VAIAEFGGAYLPSDLATFCRQQARPEPTVKQVGLGVPVLAEEQVSAPVLTSSSTSRSSTRKGGSISSTR